MAYVRNTRVRAKVMIQADRKLAAPMIYLKGEGPDGLHFEAEPGDIDGDTVTAALYSGKLPNHVDYRDASDF